MTIKWDDGYFVGSFDFEGKTYSQKTATKDFCISNGKATYSGISGDYKLEDLIIEDHANI